MRLLALVLAICMVFGCCAYATEEDRVDKANLSEEEIAMLDADPEQTLVDAIEAEPEVLETNEVQEVFSVMVEDALPPLKREA